MFVINQSPTFKWPVTFKLPADGGKHDSFPVTLVLKRLPQSEIKALTAGATEANPDLVSTDEAFARAVLAGWEGVVDDEKKPVDFTPHALEQFLDIPLVASTIALAYLEAIQGGLKRKN